MPNNTNMLTILLIVVFPSDINTKIRRLNFASQANGCVYKESMHKHDRSENKNDLQMFADYTETRCCILLSNFTKCCIITSIIFCGPDFHVKPFFFSFLFSSNNNKRWQLI